MTTSSTAGLWSSPRECAWHDAICDIWRHRAGCRTCTDAVRCLVGADLHEAEQEAYRAARAEMYATEGVS